MPLAPAPFHRSIPLVRLLPLVLCCLLLAPPSALIPASAANHSVVKRPGAHKSAAPAKSAPAKSPAKAAHPMTARQTTDRRDGELLVRFQPTASQADTSALLSANTTVL